MRLWNNCSGEWRHMIAVTMKTTTKRLIIHEAESTHKYHHKYPLEIHSTRKKNWNKRLTKHLGNLKKTLVKLQVISRWPRARQCRGPVRMLLINKGVSPLVRIPAVTLLVNWVWDIFNWPEKQRFQTDFLSTWMFLSELCHDVIT